MKIHNDGSMKNARLDNSEFIWVKNTINLAKFCFSLTWSKSILRHSVKENFSSFVKKHIETSESNFLVSKFLASNMELHYLTASKRQGKISSEMQAKLSAVH